MKITMIRDIENLDNQKPMTKEELEYYLLENKNKGILYQNDQVSIINEEVPVGQKFSSTKLEMSKLFVQFPRALQAIMLASTYGHNKYKETDKDWKNFKNVEGGSNSYWDANIRHQLDKEIEGDIDPDTELPHIFHETWNAIAKCEMWIKENNIDMKKLSKDFLENLCRTK